MRFYISNLFLIIIIHFIYFTIINCIFIGAMLSVSISAKKKAVVK